MSAGKSCIRTENIKILPVLERKIPGAVGSKIFVDAYNCVKGDLTLRISENTISLFDVEILNIIDEWIDCLSYFNNNRNVVSLTEDFETIAYMYKFGESSIDFYWYKIDMKNDIDVDNFIGTLDFNEFERSLIEEKQEILKHYNVFL